MDYLKNFSKLGNEGKNLTVFLIKFIYIAQIVIQINIKGYKYNRTLTIYINKINKNKNYICTYRNSCKYSIFDIFMGQSNLLFWLSKRFMETFLLNGLILPERNKSNNDFIRYWWFCYYVSHKIKHHGKTVFSDLNQSKHDKIFVKRKFCRDCSHIIHPFWKS